MIEYKFIVDLVVFSGLLILLFFVASGWGLVTARAVGLQPTKPSLDHVWLGLAMILAIVEIVHFVLPIDWKVSSFVFLVGLVACAIKANSLKREMSCWGVPSLKKRPTIQLIGFMCFLLWVIKAMEVPAHYDSGLYHFNSIRWLNQFPLVPGLGNLHDRLAFNQSWFGFAALLNFGPFFNKAYAIPGLFLVMLGVLHILVEYAKKVSNLKIIAPLLVFSILINLRQISSPSPDIPINVLLLVIFISLLGFLDDEGANEAERRLRITTIIALCVSVVTIKLSSAAFAATVFMITAITSRRAMDRARIFAVAALTVVLSLPHLLRGYALSGAPLFPSTIAGGWSLEWAMPIEQAKNAADWVYCWARRPGSECMSALGNWGWVGEWWDRAPISMKLPLGLVILMGAMGALRKADGTNKRNLKNLYICAIPLALSAIFWFLTAPDPRFLGGTLHMAVGVSATVLLCKYGQKLAISRYTQNVSLALMWAVVLLSTLKFTGLPSDVRNQILQGGVQPIQSVELVDQKTGSGLVVKVPVTGDQCFDSPIPCTPYFNERLTLVETQSSWPRMYFTYKNSSPNN